MENLQNIEQEINKIHEIREQLYTNDTPISSKFSEAIQSSPQSPSKPPLPHSKSPNRGNHKISSIKISQLKSFLPSLSTYLSYDLSPLIDIIFTKYNNNPQTTINYQSFKQFLLDFFDKKEEKLSEIIYYSSPSPAESLKNSIKINKINDIVNDNVNDNVNEDNKIKQTLSLIDDKNLLILHRSLYILKKKLDLYHRDVKRIYNKFKEKIDSFPDELIINCNDIIDALKDIGKCCLINIDEIKKYDDINYKELYFDYIYFNNEKINNMLMDFIMKYRRKYNEIYKAKKENRTGFNLSKYEEEFEDGKGDDKLNQKDELIREYIDLNSANKETENSAEKNNKNEVNNKENVINNSINIVNYKDKIVNNQEIPLNKKENSPKNKIFNPLTKENNQIQNDNLSSNQKNQPQCKDIKSSFSGEDSNIDKDVVSTLNKNEVSLPIEHESPKDQLPNNENENDEKKSNPSSISDDTVSYIPPNQQNPPNKKTKYFIFSEILPLILADFITKNPSFVILDHGNEIRSKLKTIFDYEIINKLPNDERMDIIKERKIEVQKLLFNQKNIDRNIFNYNRMLNQGKVNGNGNKYIEKALRELDSYKGWIENRIRCIKEEEGVCHFEGIDYNCINNNNNIDSKITNNNENNYTQRNNSNNDGINEMNSYRENKNDDNRNIKSSNSTFDDKSSINNNNNNNNQFDNVSNDPRDQSYVQHNKNQTIKIKVDKTNRDNNPKENVNININNMQSNNSNLNNINKINPPNLQDFPTSNINNTNNNPNMISSLSNPNNPDTPNMINNINPTENFKENILSSSSKEIDISQILNQSTHNMNNIITSQEQNLPKIPTNNNNNANINKINNNNNNNNSTHSNRQSKQPPKPLKSLAEQRLHSLKEIFYFYSHQHTLTGHASTFDLIKEKTEKINISEFMKFCLDFNIKIPKEIISETFKISSSNKRELTFEEFQISLLNLSQKLKEENIKNINNKIKNLKKQLKNIKENDFLTKELIENQINYSKKELDFNNNKKADNVLDDLYLFLEIDFVDKYQGKMKGFALPFKGNTGGREVRLPKIKGNLTSIYNKNNGNNVDKSKVDNTLSEINEILSQSSNKTNGNKGKIKLKTNKEINRIREKYNNMNNMNNNCGENNKKSKSNEKYIQKNIVNFDNIAKHTVKNNNNKFLLKNLNIEEDDNNKVNSIKNSKVSRTDVRKTKTPIMNKTNNNNKNKNNVNSYTLIHRDRIHNVMGELNNKRFNEDEGINDNKILDKNEEDIKDKEEIKSDKSKKLLNISRKYGNNEINENLASNRNSNSALDYTDHVNKKPSGNRITWTAIEHMNINQILDDKEIMNLLE